MCYLDISSTGFHSDPPGGERKQGLSYAEVTNCLSKTTSQQKDHLAAKTRTKRPSRASTAMNPSEITPSPPHRPPSSVEWSRICIFDFEADAKGRTDGLLGVSGTAGRAVQRREGENMNRLTLESNVGVVSPKHLSASPIF